MSANNADITFLKKFFRLLAIEHSKYIKFDTKRPNQFAGEMQQFENIINDNILNKIQCFDVELFRDGVKKVLSQCKDKFNVNPPNQNIIEIFTLFKKRENIPKEETTSELIYNLLSTIFHNTNQTQRQQFFHDLLEVYYEILTEQLLGMNIPINTFLPQDIFERKIKTFLPYVKLEMLHHFWKEKNSDMDNFISAVTELNEYFLYPNLMREDCYKILRNKFNSNNYTILKYELVPLEGRPGFLGDYFKLKITTNYNDNLEVCHLFAKYLPTSNETSKMLALMSFKKETFFYKTVLSHLNESGFKDITDFAPACYFLRNDDVIVMEDISVLSYRSSDIAQSLDYETAVLSVKQLAKFHACSLVFEKSMSKKMGKVVSFDKDYSEYLDEVIFVNEGSNKELIACSARTIIDYIVPKCDDLYKDISLEDFTEWIKTSINYMYQIVKPSTKYKNFLGHGDVWGGNILLKRDDKGKAISTYLIDYQLIRYCLPTVDLLFMLYTNTVKDFREKHMAQLIEQYYQDLSNILKRHDIDLSEIYDYWTYLRHCREMRAAAICQALSYTQVLCCPEEVRDSIIDDEDKAKYFYTINRTEVLEQVWQQESYYRLRMRGYIEDLYEICCEKL